MSDRGFAYENEFNEYLELLGQFKRMLYGKRKNLEDYANSANAKRGFVSKENYQLRVSHDFIQIVESLISGLDSIGMFGDDYYQRRHRELALENKQLKEELEVLKLVNGWDNIAMSKIKNSAYKIAGNKEAKRDAVKSRAMQKWSELY